MVKAKAFATRFDMFEERLNAAMQELQEKNCRILSIQCVETGALVMMVAILYDTMPTKQNKPA